MLRNYRNLRISRDHRSIRPLLCSLFAIAAATSTVTCGGDDDDMDPSADDDDDDDDGGWECDPVGAIPEVGALLNAPLDPVVEIIVKVPQHPGNPGPVGLP